MHARLAVAMALFAVPSAAFAQEVAPPPPPSDTPHVPLVIESIGREQDIAEFRGSVISTHRIASREPIRETVLPSVVIGSFRGGGASLRLGWRF